mgnify:CR=1 FL=1
MNIDFARERMLNADVTTMSVGTTKAAFTTTTGC